MKPKLRFALTFIPTSNDLNVFSSRQGRILLGLLILRRTWHLNPMGTSCSQAFGKLCFFWGEGKDKVYMSIRWTSAY